MGMLKPLTGVGYLKAGFQGFSKSGKTWTAAQLAIGLKKHLKLKGPIAMFDTEGGSEYIAPMVKKETGQELLAVKSRSFADMLATGQEAEKDGVAVLIADSQTHPWREVCDAYLVGVNQARAAKGQKPRTRLEFQDWNPIKATWATWTDFYLNSKLHIIIAGRAGYEYDYEMNEETGRKELQKTGVKMKTEGEFGFEPSLLVEMERVQLRGDDMSPVKIVHRATVLGDRFNVLDGKTADNPGFDFFLPHIQMLTKGGDSAGIDTTVKTNIPVDDSGDAEFAKERRTRAILCEEIQGELVRAWPGQTGDEKKAKIEAIEAGFNTRSWTKVENLDSAALRRGLETIQKMVAAAKPVAPKTEKKGGAE